MEKKICKSCEVDKSISEYYHNKIRFDTYCRHSCIFYTSMEYDNFKLCWSLKNSRPLSAKQKFSLGIELLKNKKGRK